MIRAPQFSSIQFVKTRDTLERTEPHIWSECILHILKQLAPENDELLLLNLLQTCTRELENGRSPTLYICYLHRKWLFLHVTQLLNMQQMAATKFCLQLSKFIEMWLEYLQSCDKFEMAEYLIRVLRFLMTLQYTETDLRAKLICKRLAQPLSWACREFECFKYIITNILVKVLPFSYNALD